MKDKKVNNTTLIILLIGIIISSVLLFGKFAYSFLGSDIGEDVWSDGEVTATGDTLVFSKGEALSISASTDNFNLTTGNLSSTTHPKAKLMANNKTNNATASYSTGINIKRNTYKYTTSDNKPELILTVQDEAGNNITSAEGLTYVTNINGVSGFDITTKKGTIAIVNNHTITTTSTTTHTWTYTLTFINYQTDQSLNENASIELDIIYQSDEITNSKTLAEHITSTYGTDSTLYYHDSNLANGANDNSYRYAGANPNNYVCFGTNEETCPNDNLYRVIGVFDNQVKLIKHDYATRTSLGTNGDYARKYTGGTENYKGDLSTNDFFTYYYNATENNGGTGNNNWNESRLNTINLNTNYLQSLGEEWVNRIADTTWFVGGGTAANIRDSNAKIAYNYEVGSQRINKTYKSKIGLIYISEYYYAASPDYWHLPGWIPSGNDYSLAANDNWMFMGLIDWAITPTTDYTDTTFDTFLTGVSGYSRMNIDLMVRPTFNLEKNVVFMGGQGTKTNPWKLS